MEEDDNWRVTLAMVDRILIWGGTGQTAGLPVDFYA